MSAPRDDEKLYYRIGEVCQRLDLEPHTLRNWETEIPALKPRKNRAGHRIFSREDIALIQQIKELLQGEGFTLAGARKQLSATQKTNIPEATLGESKHSAKLKKGLSDVRKILKSARKLLEPEG